MPRGEGIHTKQLTEHDRIRVRTLYYDAYLGPAEIAKRTGYSRVQVRHAIRANSTTPGSRSGRPRTMTPEQEAQLIEHVSSKEGCRPSYEQLAADLFDGAFGMSTIRSALRRHGFMRQRGKFVRSPGSTSGKSRTNTSTKPSEMAMAQDEADSSATSPTTFAPTAVQSEAGSSTTPLAMSTARNEGDSSTTPAAAMASQSETDSVPTPSAMPTVQGISPITPATVAVIQPETHSSQPTPSAMPVVQFQGVTPAAATVVQSETDGSPTPSQTAWAIVRGNPERMHETDVLPLAAGN